MPERVHHPIFARVFGALIASPLGAATDRDRIRLLDGIAGRVVEIGAGSGANFRFYPAEVDEVVAIEPEAYLRAKAEQAARSAPATITVINGTAATLPLPDASFDAGVVSLMLCSVGSVDAALAELRRVIKPGGELRFYEHVAFDAGRIMPAVQRAVDATIWPRLFGGCHTARDPVASIERAGFAIERVKRMTMKPLGIPTPITPHVIGLARRP